MGISEAFYIPAALALIADLHAGPTRSRAVGLHQTAIYAGVILGGFAGYIADDPALGWRFAFAASGVVGMAYALPLLWLLRDPPRTSVEPRDSPLLDAGELAANGSFVLMVLYFTLPAMAAWIVRDWMPAILQERFDLSQGKAGVSATLFWTAAAILGAALGGWWADRWTMRNIRGRIYVSAIGMLLIAPAVFGVGSSGSVAAAVAFLTLFGVGWGFFDGNTMPILAQIVRPRLRATAYGVMNFVSISGGGLADWGFGVLRDRAIPIGAIFGLFAAAALASTGLVLLIRPRREL
jgi:MFS family permease